MRSFLSLVSILLFLASGQHALGGEAYAPRVDPAEFSTKIDHPFFSLPVGRKLVFEAKTKEGLERAVIEITGETRTIMGVTTLVYHDREWVDGELVEDTRDFLAQHKNGDVWYFGETVDNYEDGKIVDHDGSWIAGEDGAQPGIWIKGNAQIGDRYRQEYLKGEAEDMIDVLATDVEVETALGKFSGCLKLLNWTPLDRKAKEHKYYCRQPAALVLIVHPRGGARVELKNVE